MRSTTLFLIGAAMLLFAMEASSEEFTILEGEFIDAASGEAQALTGRLEIRPADGAFEDGYYIDDFELETDAETFLPSLPIEYNGLTARFFRIADQIRNDGDQASLFFYLRSGGHLVGAEGDLVTFRFFDFRGSSVPVPDSPFPIPFRHLDPSRRLPPAPGAERESLDIPRRFDLYGTLEQVDQRFRIVDQGCPESPLDPLPPDGVVIVALDPVRPLPPGGVVIIAPDRIRPTFENARPASPMPRLRPFDPSGRGWSGGSLSWNLQILNVTFTPILEELNITAPQGAEISVAEDASLSVYTRGDLYLDGPIPELQGVERIEITAEGEIILGSNFEPPADVTLEVNSGANSALSPNPVPCGFVPGLHPTFLVETVELGSFSMIASAAPEAVEVELLSRRKPYPLRPRSRKPIWLALFGSETLDVSEIDRSTLRLGPAGGEPIHRFGRPLVLPWDWNRDGHRDLLAVFKSRNLGVAYGEDELCLHAETEQGQRLEGCDEIETRGSRSRRPSRDRDRHEPRH